MKGQRMAATRGFLNIDNWTESQQYFSAGFLLTALFLLCLLSKWVVVGMLVLSAAVMFWHAPAAWKKKEGKDGIQKSKS